MQIHEAAEHLGVSARTLRHYEEAGLIRPRRRANGYRDLSAADLQKAEWVRDLVAAGFSLRELRALVAAVEKPRTEPVCVGALRDKLAQIDRLSTRLAERRRAVAARLAAQQALDSMTDKEPIPDESPQHSRPPLPAARPVR